MKVVLINHSDVRGGASVVTLRLTEALHDTGVDATMLVGHKEGDSPLVEEGSQWRRKLSFAAEHLDIVAHNKFSRDNLFKISTGRFGMGLSRHPLVEEADIVVLAWINQGTLSLDEIARIARRKPVVWVMHDRWCYTGVCHHVPDSCDRLASRCGMCPLLKTHSYEDLSRKVFMDKLRLYGHVPYPALSFIAVSTWLKEVWPGGLIDSGRVEVIPNVFPVGDYSWQPRRTRSELSLPEGPLITMGAARLDDPIKNLPLAVEALNRINTPATAVFFGGVKDPGAFDGLRMPYVHLGPLTQERVADVLSHTDVVLSTSRFETLPTTLIEGMASGAWPVTTGNGGQADIIADGVDGDITTDDAGSIAALTERAILAGHDRRLQHEACERRFDCGVVARRYVEHFEKVIRDFRKSK